MTRHTTISTHISRPIWRSLVGPLVASGMIIAATACGPGPTSQSATATAPVVDQTPEADDDFFVSTGVEESSGPPSALLDGTEFAKAVDAAIAAHHRAMTVPASALLDGAEFARAVEAAIAGQLP